MTLTCLFGASACCVFVQRACVKILFFSRQNMTNGIFVASARFLANNGRIQTELLPQETAPTAQLQNSQN